MDRAGRTEERHPVGVRRETDLDRHGSRPGQLRVRGMAISAILTRCGRPGKRSSGVVGVCWLTGNLPTLLRPEPGDRSLLRQLPPAAGRRCCTANAKRPARVASGRTDTGSGSPHAAARCISGDTRATRPTSGRLTSSDPRPRNLRLDAATVRAAHLCGNFHGSDQPTTGPEVEAAVSAPVRTWPGFVGLITARGLVVGPGTSGGGNPW